MAGKSRIHRIGSIFERVSGLIESGVIKPDDHPIWFEVYKHHPPKYNPVFDRSALKHIEVKPIFYEEDVVRAEIHKLRKYDVFDLTSDYKKSKTVLCKEIMKEGVSLQEAIARVEIKDIHIPRNRQESTIFEDLAEVKDEY